MNIALITNEFPPNIVGGGISEALFSLQNSYSKNIGKMCVFNTNISDPKKDCFKSLTIEKEVLNFRYGKFITEIVRIIKNGNIIHYIKFIFNYFKFFFKNPYVNWRKSIIWPSQLILIFESVENTLEYFMKSNFDIIFPGKLGFESIIGYILKLMTKRKLIVFCHGNDFLNINIWRKFIVYHSDAIIMGTKKMKNLFNSLYLDISSPIYLIPYGIRIKDYDISKTKLQLRKELKIDTNEFVIISVGRHVYRKGFDLVLKALKNIRAIDSKFKFKYFLIGKGPDTNNLISLAKKLDLKKEIEFLGYLNETERNMYYKASDIFIMTSRKKVSTDIEGFGIIYLEANFYGLPIIAANAGGVLEAVGESGGFLIEPENIEEIENSILLLYNDKKLRKKMSIDVHNRIITNFSWDKLVLKYQKVFSEILEN